MVEVVTVKDIAANEEVSFVNLLFDLLTDIELRFQSPTSTLPFREFSDKRL